MNNNTHEIRKLPKKTIITIAIIIILGALVFLGLKELKEAKMTEIIATLGHKNIEQMQVINKLRVQDEKTKYKSTVYKVMFFDKDTDKTCIGFIHMGRNDNYSKDLNCKK
ncbi:MAG: hypothetical protein ACQERD_03030 [Campylobacterota bacterium]